MPTLARVSPSRLLARILDHPELVRVVQRIEPPVLRALVEHVGLEDAGEIVALATTEQLQRVFDEDLWKSDAPGDDASFDADRFGLWLEVLLEVGEKEAVEKIASMDEDLLALGFGRHMIVLEVDALAALMASMDRDERVEMEKMLEGQLDEEIDEFRLVAREGAAWDSIVRVIVALDQQHPALVRRVLERLWMATRERIDDDGLRDALTEEEMITSDVADDRDQRREREGFVAPSAAKSFLRYAAASTLDDLVRARTPDAITRSHFRAAPPTTAPSLRDADVEAFLARLRAAGVGRERADDAPRLEENTRQNPSILHATMRVLRDDPTACARALDELAYLVNVLVAASGIRAVEANDVVTAVCGLGLLTIAGRASRDVGALATIAKERGLSNAFHVGWHFVGGEPWTTESLKSAAQRVRAAHSSSRTSRVSRIRA
jgi:hypothetical protein